jgi:hypothetical protein
VSRLIRLYPDAWRERYGEEFAALLEERPPTIRERFDIVGGAIDAHMHPTVSPGPRMPIDRWWLVPLAGWGLLAIAIGLMASGPVRYDEYGSYRDGSAAVLPFVASIWLLIAGLGRLMLRVPSDARVARVAGSVAVVSGALWAFGPWSPPLGVTFFGAFIVAVAAAWRAVSIPGWIAIALGVCLVAPAAAYCAMLVLPWYAGRENPALLLMVLPVCLAWPLVSLSLRRVTDGDIALSAVL